MFEKVEKNFENIIKIYWFLRRKAIKYKKEWIKMEIFAYGRVSTMEQSERRQMDAFFAEGIDEMHIFIDKISGKSFERSQYNLLVGTEISAGLLREGDLLTC